MPNPRTPRTSSHSTSSYGSSYSTSSDGTSGYTSGGSGRGSDGSPARSSAPRGGAPRGSAPRSGASRGSGRPQRTARSSAPVRRPAPVVSELERAFATAAAAAPVPGTTFASLGLPQHLITALERRGVREPFAIQARAIPDALEGRDVLGRAQTGSGKTLAFGLPLLARLAGQPRTPGTPRGLVLVPTRELAEQVKEALSPLGQALDLRITAVYGGASMGRQIDALRRGVDVVIATPGRLLDLIGQRQCTLASVDITVLDEADYMADLGFLPVVTDLLGQTRPGGQRLLFSATLDNGVEKLVRQFLDSPALHAVAPAAAPVETMDHRAFSVRADDKIDIAAEIAARPGRTLIFVRTKHGADRLAKQLQRTGVEAGAIHGNLAQNARQRALNAFADGRARVLVATDVAARGIHVDDVDLVMHFDPPADSKDYLHRSGRTARAGASGVVLSLLLPEQVRDAGRMYDQAGVRAATAVVQPGSEAVRELATSGTPIVPKPLSSPDPTSPGSSGSRPGGRRRPQVGRGRPGGAGVRAPRRTSTPR